MFSRRFYENSQSIASDLSIVDLSLDRGRWKHSIRGRRRKDKASPRKVRRSLAQGRCGWRARSLHGRLRVAAASRRNAAHRAKGIERILVSARFPANPNHKVGRDATEYRRRWTDRL